MLRENEEQIAAQDAQSLAGYTREEALQILADLGMRAPTYEGLLADEQRRHEAVLDVTANANRANALSGDDIQVIKTLYSDHPNRSNDSCTYSGAYRNFGAIPYIGCPPNSIASGAQDVCCAPTCGTCGGANCSSRPGSTDGCCTGRIINNAVSCTGRLSGPCVMP